MGNNDHGMKILVLVAVCLVVHAQAGHGQAGEALGTIRGLPKPQVADLPEGARQYGYSEYIVIAAPRRASAGEEILIRKRASADGRAGTAAGATVLRLANNEDADYFAGISGDAAFVIAQTGPDGVLKIYDLRAGRKVFEGGFRGESAKMAGRNTLEFEKEVQGGVDRLDASEAKRFPKIKQWLDQGGSAGWFQRVRLNLGTFETVNVGEPQLRAMQ